MGIFSFDGYTINPACILYVGEIYEVHVGKDKKSYAFRVEIGRDGDYMRFFDDSKKVLDGKREDFCHKWNEALNEL